MKTIVSVINTAGEHLIVKQPSPKPIELKYILAADMEHGMCTACTACRGASRYKYVELICLNYVESGPCGGLDLIFCHNGDRSDGVLYAGHWNDGVVNCCDE